MELQARVFFHKGYLIFEKLNCVETDNIRALFQIIQGADNLGMSIEAFEAISGLQRGPKKFGDIEWYYGFCNDSSSSDGTNLASYFSWDGRPRTIKKVSRIKPSYDFEIGGYVSIPNSDAPDVLIQQIENLIENQKALDASPTLHDDEAKWLKDIQNLLNRCPSERIGFDVTDILNGNIVVTNVVHPGNEPLGELRTPFGVSS